MRSIDKLYPVGLPRREFAISNANLLVEFQRLPFHPIDWPSWTHPAKHACTSGFRIYIENEGQIGPAVADGEIIKMADHLLVKTARNSLVNGGGIGKAIREYDRPALERGTDRFAYELASARFEEQQLRLGRHRHTLRRKLQKIANRFAYRSAARFPRNQ